MFNFNFVLLTYIDDDGVKSRQLIDIGKIESVHEYGDDRNRTVAYVNGNQYLIAELFEEVCAKLGVYLPPSDFPSTQSNRSIESLDLSRRSTHVLKYHGVNTVDDLALLSIAELTKFRNMGSKSLKEVVDRMKNCLNIDLAVAPEIGKDCRLCKSFKEGYFMDCPGKSKCSGAKLKGNNNVNEA